MHVRCHEVGPEIVEAVPFFNDRNGVRVHRLLSVDVGCLVYGRDLADTAFLGMYGGQQFLECGEKFRGMSLFGRDSCDYVNHNVISPSVDGGRGAETIGMINGSLPFQ